MSSPDRWHYLLSGETKGPITRAEFAALATAGRVRPETLVWQPSMQDWMPAIETDLSSLLAPPLPKRRAPSRAKLPLSEEQYFSCAVLGLVAAAISSAITIDDVVPTQIHGLIFPVVLCAYFHRLGLVNILRIAGICIFTATAYFAAYAISYHSYNADIGSSSLALPGFGSGTVGFLLPMTMFFLFREKPQVSLYSYLIAAVPFAFYGCFVMPLAATIEKPSLMYPTEFGTSMLIHAPWQAAFAVALAFFLGKSNYRNLD
ncbi:DUF4339 domain-containing protein [uncultured Roseovarius sp.]|uniref:DUF4339 domain-containing protein n=1 Tax=uncultured Roseovarius sp. TaxID=293344 RepID=UPI002628177E|nr:DUF4339 domain-containing protein [uncultured Roseovarius sp.]